MRKVKDLRLEKRWSAGQLAEAMTAAGVPWDRSVVANLENGRRKSLRVHELYALAYVLGVDTPMELLVPWFRDGGDFPVTPKVSVDRQAVRAWFVRGNDIVLPKWIEMSPDERMELLARERSEAMASVMRLDEPTTGTPGMVRGWSTPPAEPDEGEGD